MKKTRELKKLLAVVFAGAIAVTAFVFADGRPLTVANVYYQLSW